MSEASGVPPRWSVGRLGDRAGDGLHAACRGVVVKFGGSLLDRPCWPEDIRSLLAALDRPATIVVGGGRLVDALRLLDRSCPRSEDVMHRLAIDCMGITARLMAAATGMPLVEEPVSSGGTAAVLDAPRWFAREGRWARLPVGWHVTSDSIAALVAAESDASLVLAKSVAPPCPADLADLAARDWVDAHFPQAARRLRRTIMWATPAVRA